MSQSSHSVGNVSAPAFRAAMNDSLQALASLNSGPSAPSTTYANMLWYDTAANILYMRSEADDAWIVIGTLNQSTNTFAVSGITNAAIIAGLGFTPVQQGGGAGQGNNKIFLGWDGGGLRLQVDDNSSFGRIALQSDVAQLSVQRFIPTTTRSVSYNAGAGPTVRDFFFTSLPAGFYVVTLTFTASFQGAGSDDSYQTSYQMFHVKNGSAVLLQSGTAFDGQSRVFSVTEQLYFFGGNDFFRITQPDLPFNFNFNTTATVTLTAKGPYENASYVS